MPQLITRQYEKQTQITIFLKIQRQLITFLNRWEQMQAMHFCGAAREWATKSVNVSY